MATYRKPAVNKQPRGAFINGANNSDIKYKGRSGVVVPNRVFVGGICPTATENDLANLFGKYGVVKAIKIVFDQNGSSKGYGFVTFEKADDVSRLQNDAKNLTFNDRRLNIAPAVMKNPPFVGRFPEYVVPLSSNVYVPYSYQDAAAMYPNNGYPSHITVMPTVADHGYYSSNYASPTPYHGPALFYPMSANGSPVLVGPQSYSTYQPVVSNSSNYVYSSSSSVTTSPTNSSGKPVTPLSTPSTTSEIHGSNGPPIIAAAMPPNMSTMPPPLPYPLSPPPAYYNGNMMPPYPSDLYYGVVHQGACYPMIMNGQESYIPYYDVGESCSSSNVTPEDSNYETPSYLHNINAGQSYAMEASGKDVNPASSNGGVNGNGNIHNGDCKQSMQSGPPPTSEHHLEPNYPVENSNTHNTNALPPPAANPIPPTQSSNSISAAVEYNNPPIYIQHRNALAYPNGPMQQPNIYFNSVYMAEAAPSSLGSCSYSKNLSDQYVSDHLPKRDTKYVQKKYNPSPNKDAPPNIPKFPFFINNNYPGFVNRNVKDKDFNKNGRSGETKQSPRVPRNNPGNNMPPKPRVFHNQNQYGGPPRAPRNDRNGHMMSMQNARTGGPIPSRQNSYDQTQLNSFEYQNNYQPYPHYPKPNSHEGHRKYGQNTNNNYWAKCDKGNNAGGHDGCSKSNVEERPRKYVPAEEPIAANNERVQTEQNGNVQQPPTAPSQQQVCIEMQKLTL